MKIEICCGGYHDAEVAIKNGAHRIELCSCLYFGGLTPSVGSLQLIKEKYGAETAAMVRPREGGFCYSDEEFEVMLRDGDELIKNGADALVFGFLTRDGHIDKDKTARFLDMIDSRCQSVFHKAFDVAKDELIDGALLLKSMGVSRILTAGKEKTALLGAENIKKLIDLGGIDILPCGSVRRHNLKELYEKTGAAWAHSSAFSPAFDNSADHDSILFTPLSAPKAGEYPLTQGDTVKELVSFALSL